MLQDRCPSGAGLIGSLGGVGILALPPHSTGLSTAGAGAQQELGLLGLCALQLRAPVCFGAALPLMGILIFAGDACAAEAAPLWAAPAHLLGAALLGAYLVWEPRRGTSWTRRGIAAVGVLLLGALWVACLDTLGRRPWAWDWIEVAPPLAALEAGARPHGWGRSFVGGGSLATWAILGAARTGLLTTTHHLIPWEETVGRSGRTEIIPAYPESAGLGFLVLGLALLPASLTRPPLQGGRGRVRRVGRLHVLGALGISLGVLGTGALVGPLPAWLWWGWLGARLRMP